MASEIVEYGKEILSKYCLYDKRIFFNNGYTDLITILDYINTEYGINLRQYDIKICDKTYYPNDFMKYHVDDCALIKHKKKLNKSELHNNTMLANKYSLCHKNPLPVYTMVIYLNSHGELNSG